MSCAQRPRRARCAWSSAWTPSSACRNGTSGATCSSWRTSSWRIAPAGPRRADGPLGELLATRGTQRVDDLHDHLAGRIHVRPVTQLEISSTELRDLIVAGRDPRYLLPDAVRAIIRDTVCYQSAPTR